MRRDILLGALLASILHLTVAVYSHLTKAPAPIRIPIAKVDPIVVPLLPADVVDIDDQKKDDPVAEVPLLPTIPDVPQPVADRDFVIPLDPPRPIDARSTFVAYQIPPNTGSGNGTGRTVFTLDQVERAPQVVLQVPAAYPAAMRSQKITGEVVVRFIVDADNHVRDVRVVSSNQREFEQPTVQAVQKWQFKAGLKGGRPVPVQMEVPIRFNLK